MMEFIDPARTVGTGVLVAMGAFWCPLAALYAYVSSSPSARRKFSEEVISPREDPPRAHAIAAVGDAADVRQWASSLGRSCHWTINKQVDKAYAKYGIEVHSIAPKEMGLEHFWVVYSHQCKTYGKGNEAQAFLFSICRFLVAKMMTGVIDEYRTSLPGKGVDGSGPSLIGWSHTIVKGNTLRGMWFYQSEYASSSKMFLWFGSLRASFARAIAIDGCDWVDLGPSYNERVSNAKAKYGFEITESWNNKTKNDYHSGPFCDDIPLHKDLKFT